MAPAVAPQEIPRCPAAPDDRQQGTAGRLAGACEQAVHQRLSHVGFAVPQEAPYAGKHGGTAAQRRASVASRQHSSSAELCWGLAVAQQQAGMAWHDVASRQAGRRAGGQATPWPALLRQVAPMSQMVGVPGSHLHPPERTAAGQQACSSG